MVSAVRPSHFVYAMAEIALGITGLVNGEFARGFQIIPLHYFPGQTFLACATALVEVLIGVGLLLKPTIVAASLAAVLFMLLWLLLLELPWSCAHRWCRSHGPA